MNQHLHELACLAQQFAARGWVVRLEPETAPGTPAPHPGQVTVRRGGSCPSRYVLRQLNRHQIQVAEQHGRRLLVLGRAVDVDDALHLIRHSAGGRATAPTSRTPRAASSEAGRVSAAGRHQAVPT